MFPSSLFSAGDTIYCIGFAASRDTDISNYLSHYIKHFEQSPDAHTIYGLVPGFNPNEFMMQFQPSQIEYLHSKIKETTTLNTDTLPVAYFTYLSYLLHQSDSLLMKSITNPYVHTFLLLLIIAANVAFFKSRSSAHLHFGSIIFISGYISMAAMIIALIAYQNVYGMLYHKIALCNGLFMLGLAIGSVTTFSKKDFYTFRIILLFVGLAMLFAFTVFHHVLVFYTSIMVIAAVTGSLLPLLLKKETVNNKLLASTLDAADHSGALCAALTTPFLLLPVLGMYSIGVLIILSLMLLICKP